MAARMSVMRAVRLASPAKVSTAALRPNIWMQCSHRSRQFSVASALRAKKYSEDHEWIELSEDKKTATLGISKYAADALGDVIYVELPQEGLEANAGDSIGAVESVKSANDIITPVTGTVVTANNALEDEPSKLNIDPEGDGWIAKIEIGEDGVAALEKLMDADAYKSFTEEANEEH
ncbi:glycine cleavage system H protein [Verruconis gallopava]|uniref:Glycine cleavage system H protein n=1 Tax=Verruconis gallopava TaxID=253628 RepID=A0A0D2A049_9PEZI|nr:glycine cleavage system H protein [Verruconis gallopava]KIV99992.1 glycine cleavage system H protein [Verruconis gallopava]